MQVIWEFVLQISSEGKIDKIIEINYYLTKLVYILFLALFLCKEKAKGE